MRTSSVLDDFSLHLAVGKIAQGRLKSRQLLNHDTGSEGHVCGKVFIQHLARLVQPPASARVPDRCRETPA